MAKRKKKHTSNNMQPEVKIPIPAVGRNRIIATAIDWFIGGIVSGFPSVLAFALLSGTGKPLTNLYTLESLGYDRRITIIIAFVCLLVGFTYYVIVPWRIFPGQTIGKKIMKLRIVHLDGRAMHVQDYFVRQFIFLICIEGAATATSTYIKVIITTITRFYVDGYLSIFWNVITLLSIFLVFGSHKHLAIHDYAAKTTVVAL